jgi:hypothetical protein
MYSFLKDKEVTVGKYRRQKLESFRKNKFPLLNSSTTLGPAEAIPEERQKALPVSLPTVRKEQIKTPKM